ncbi:MAG: ABC transporter permease [Armatimonadota bacterium]
MAQAIQPWSGPIPRRRGRGRFSRLLRSQLAVLSGLFIIAVSVLAFAAGPAIVPYDPNRADLTATFAAPSAAHWLGTDENGRDVLARLIAGARVSLVIGLFSALVGVALGSAMGAAAGYWGGRVDTVSMRFTDGMMAIPGFFLILLVVTIFGTRVGNIVIALALTRWMPVARLVRGEVLRWRTAPFVDAARALGARDGRIVFGHLLPQAAPSIVVATTLAIPQAILLESSLSFLGLGVQPPTPSWGNMLSNSQNYLWSNPTLAVYPGVAILLTVLAFNAFGDGLRDALDPYMRGRR